jgi:solute carrier family 35 protein E3
MAPPPRATPPAALAALLAWNVTSSVTVVFVNKHLAFAAAGFTFGAALTLLHFLFAAAAVLALAAAGGAPLKRLPLRRVLPVCAAFCGYVVANNMSLMTNSVSVFQICKILVTPLIVLVERVCLGTAQSPATLVALAPMSVGIAVTVFTDAAVAPAGLAWAALAVSCNAAYTISLKHAAAAAAATPAQMLAYQLPLSAAALLAALPWVEDLGALRAFAWTPFAAACVLASCLAELSSFASFALLLDRSTPLTANVTTNLKTCLVFVVGWAFFGAALSRQSAAGIAITLCGLALYARAQLAAPGSR